MIQRPRSMTAFGRGEHTRGQQTWVVELRSVNHRYCDINVRMPKKYLGLEERVKREISQEYARGRIDVSIELSGPSAMALHLAPNTGLAREYQLCLRTLKEELGLTGEASLAMIAAYQDVIVPVERDEDLEEVWPGIREALAGALEGALRMRLDEGANLRADILPRLDAFARTVASIESQAPSLVEKKEAALKERLERLLDAVDLDPARLAQECAILVDKADVTEELVRLHSHMQQFSAFFELDEPIGRRLDFLAQELLRELNTMSAKINEAAVGHQIVELKNDLEKIREQVQNIE